MILLESDSLRIVAVNPVVERLAAASAEDLRGRPVLECLRPVHPVLGGEPFRLESLPSDSIWHLVSRQGEVVPLALRFQPLPRSSRLLALGRRVPGPSRVQETLRRFFDHAPDLFGVFEPSSAKLLLCNDAWTRTLGFTVEELLALPSIMELIHPDDLESSLAACKRALEHAQTGFENRYRTRNGSYRVLSWRMIQLDSGFCYGVARDVTEERRQRDRARQERELFHLAAEQLPDAVFLTDLSAIDAPGTILFANAAACQMYGLDLAEFATRSALDLIHASQRDQSPLHIARLFRGETLFCESVHRRSDGSPFPVELRARALVRDGRTFGLGVVRDISERKRSEESLRQSEERFRLSFERAPIGMALVATDGRFLQVNEALCELVGYTADELLGMTFQEITHPDDLAADLSLCAQVISGSLMYYHLEKRYRHKSGHYVTARLSVSLVRDDQGRPLHFISQIEDITQRKTAEEESRRAREAAEAANRAKTEFLASISHEVRTPLTAIIGFTEILLEDPAIALLPEARREDLLTIQQNGQHLLALLNDLLDLSRIEAGRLTIHTVPCNPVEVVDEVLAMVRPRLELKPLRFHLQLDEPVPRLIHTDATRLRQILNNLIANAVKFTPEGEVRVRLYPLQPANAPPMLAFEVADTGIGMSPETIAQVFEPFFRADDPVVRLSGGTGLGLPISRRLARKLNGVIEVESTLGQGSKVTLTIPRDLRGLPSIGWPAAPTEDALPPSLEPGTLDASILLAEDNEATLRICRFRLEKAGARVTIATNGEEAVQIARNALAEGRPFDAILMDLQMPVLDGFEATRKLRDSGYDRPIIALSAYAMIEDREQSRHLGCDAHISKPIHWPTLIALIHRLVPGRSVPRP